MKVKGIFQIAEYVKVYHHTEFVKKMVHVSQH